MAVLIEHIDAIARKKQRDVLFLEFGVPEDKKSYSSSYEYEKDPIRGEILAWLDAHNISYTMCGDFASENGWRAYRGQVYLDVVPDELDVVYKLLNEYLEDNEGKIKFKGVMYYILSLEIAMQNAHHDEPGFWEKWAENF